MSYTLSDLNNPEPALSKQIRQEISNLNNKTKIVTYWQYGRLFIDINNWSICVMIDKNEIDSINFGDGMQEEQTFKTRSKNTTEILITILQLLKPHFAN